MYTQTAKKLIPGVLSGLNGTVFAYGATGSGKTYTMVGDTKDPGMMVLSSTDVFDGVRMESTQVNFTVTCSYLEVYNELRKTEPTETNAVSSRSHAVLEIQVERFERQGTSPTLVTGKLSLVDLAGSEHASETLNTGSKLRDWANINRSLLALATCINALGEQPTSDGYRNSKTSESASESHNSSRKVYVPFRNSKLTRLLKESLSGNSRTCMVANVSCGSDQYAHTINTLKYADRAK